MAWNPDVSDKPAKPIPTTVLCGFLGAGKTTVVNEILSSSDSRKFAVIVNDLGEVNIDASLIKSAVKEVDGSIAEVLELEGGCICCSMKADLLDALLEVTQRFQPDHILVESTGVAEPKAVVDALHSGNPFGRRGTDLVKVANVVTVVDGENLQQYFECPESGKDTRRALLTDDEPQRPLVELLMEQIECADILLINKIDTLNEEACQRFEAHLKGLNHSAEIWQSRFGRIDVESLIENHRYREETTLTGAAWRRAILGNDHGRWHSWKSNKARSDDSLFLQALDDREPRPVRKQPEDVISCSDDLFKERHYKDYGLETIVFNARRAFDESLFMELMRSGFPGVIRAKGFFWTSQVPDRVGLLSIAGKTFRADYPVEWWHTMIQRGEADFNELPDLVEKSWLPVFGDRRQELVFIGIALDRKHIEKMLKKCFVNEPQADAISP